MEYNQIAKQVIDFQKISFENWYNAVSVVQDQATSNVGMLLNQGNWMPPEGRQAIQGWMEVFQAERNRFKSYMDLSFTGLERLVEMGIKESASKVQEAAPQE